MKFTIFDSKTEADQTISCNTADTYCVLLYNYSGKITVEILEKHSNVYIFGLYLGNSNTDFTLNTVQHHKAGGSVSDLLIKGVFFDASKLHYEGLIKIDKNAQQSNAYQKNQNILMSDNVYVDSRPYLEIEANDVRCTHGSTTGEIPHEEVEYLSLRGLDRKLAQKLLLTGFVTNVFDKIGSLGFEKEAHSCKMECAQQLESIIDSH